MSFVYMKSKSYHLALILLVVGGIIICSAVSARADGRENLENKLKAAFILNFAKFVQWPEEIPEGEPFRLCILGSESFLSAFVGVKGKSVAGAPVQLVEPRTHAEMQGCRLLYFDKERYENIEPDFSKLVDKPILLVSDRMGFAQAGGMIEFVMLNDRLGFKINNGRAKKSGLEFNASLLNLAVEVD